MMRLLLLRNDAAPPLTSRLLHSKSRRQRRLVMLNSNSVIPLQRQKLVAVGSSLLRISHQAVASPRSANVAAADLSRTARSACPRAALPTADELRRDRGQ